MADFFTFLGTFVSTYLKPVFRMLSDSHITMFLGTSLITVAVGFFVIRFLYSVFISHPDKVGASGISSALRSATSDKASGTTGYSSAYRKG